MVLRQLLQVAEGGGETGGGSVLEGLPRWVLFSLVLGCLLLAAVVAGLTLGLMSLDMIGLEIMTHSKTGNEARNAHVIMPIRAQGNMLLVTLLLTNTIAMEFLPLVLDILYPGGIFALVASVFSVMLFSEIIPQAVCSRHALAIGSFFIPFVRLLQFVLFPVAKPIAWMLDKLLGEELGTVYNRSELKELISVHSRNRHGVLTDDETTILHGTLDFAQKQVCKIMTNADDVFMLDLDTTILNIETFRMILRKGHSRIPIFRGSRKNVVALLLAKQLLLVDPTDEVPLGALISRGKEVHKIRVAPPLYCTSATPLEELLNEFQLGRSHMAIVYDNIGKSMEERELLGIATLEDIIEEILQEEIVDETDIYASNQTRVPRILREPGDSGGIRRRISSRAPVNPTTAASRIPGTRSILVREIEVHKLRGSLASQFVADDSLRRSATVIEVPPDDSVFELSMASPGPRSFSRSTIGEYGEEDEKPLDAQPAIHHANSGFSVASAPGEMGGGCAESPTLTDIVSTTQPSTENTPLLSVKKDI